MGTTDLVSCAVQASEYAYVPYSHFPVGAALKTKDGTIYTGCNIENVSFGLTNCGERTAIFKAISDGHKELVEIAILWRNYATCISLWGLSSGNGRIF